MPKPVLPLISRSTLTTAYTTPMIAIGKPKAMPTRGGRTATNMMKKAGRGK